MDNQNIAEKRNKSYLGGLILIVVGLFFLLDNMDLGVPAWMFSWKMLLVVLGLLIGVAHRFRGGAWLLLIIIGGFFITSDITRGELNFSRYTWPVVLIIVGIYMLLKRNAYQRTHREWRLKCGEGHRGRSTIGGSLKETASGDVIYASAIFSGEDRVVLSKNFQGGQLTAIFGGCEVNLAQADINGVVPVDVTAIFGGVELVVPSSWEVRIEVNTVFGGVEDRRPPEFLRPDPSKVLLIKGSCMFGGVEIKSFA